MICRSCVFAVAVPFACIVLSQANSVFGAHSPPTSATINGYNVITFQRPWKALGESPYRYSKFSTVKGIAGTNEVNAILSAIEHVELDVDNDTADGKPTYEMYLLPKYNDDGSIHAGGKDEPKAVREARAPARATILKVAEPILIDRITPLVNDMYDDCGGKCVPCYSLLRKYKLGERHILRPHFDRQGLVTVVVELSSGFKGGLYVVTDSEREREYVNIGVGGAVFHQSYILHGVKITKGTRWTWITWYSDDAACSASAELRWHKVKADNGNPVAQYVQHTSLMHVSQNGSKDLSDFRYAESSCTGGFPRG